MNRSRGSLFWVYLFVLLLGTSACSEQSNDRTPAAEEVASSNDASGGLPVPVPAAEAGAVEVLPQAVATAKSESPVPRDRVAQTRYKATLAVDKSLSHPGPSGELRVWIGHESQSADVPDHMVSDDAVMPALGDWSVVTPFAPGFDVEPAHPECVKVHRSGSELQFAIAPKASGTFPVGARVMLYDNARCKGAGISPRRRVRYA